MTGRRPLDGIRVLDVPADSLGTLPQPAVIPGLSLAPGQATHAGPNLGRHTDEILAGLLGLSPVQIADLRADGVV